MMPSTRNMIILLAMIWMVVISGQEDDPKPHILNIKNFIQSLQNQATRLQDQGMSLFYPKLSTTNNAQKFREKRNAYDGITKASTKQVDFSRKPTVYDNVHEKTTVSDYVSTEPTLNDSVSKKSTLYNDVSTKPTVNNDVNQNLVSIKPTVNEDVSTESISKNPTVFDDISRESTVYDNVNEKSVSTEPTVYYDISTKSTLYDDFSEESTEYHEPSKKTYRKVKKPWIRHKLVILVDVKKGSRFLDNGDTEEVKIADKKISEDFIRYLVRKEHEDEDDGILFR